LLDIMLVCERTGKALGRPWITMAIDAFTRRIMALSLSFNPPSYLSLCELVREYVRRWRRLASYFVHDGGREFRSTTFEVLMALYGSHLALRPPSEPRFGSIIERVLGILMQEVVLQLLGNTKLTKRDVRRVTREVDPRTTAVWTLAELASMLRAWAYEEYDQRDHPALLTSPRDWFERGLLHGGSRPMRLIAYDQLFQVMTMPFVSRGGGRQIHPQRGIKVSEIQYWHDVFGRPALRGTKVRTRFDPWDARRVFSFAAGSWQEARNDQIEFLEDVTVRELEFASKGLDKLGKDHRSGRTSRAAQIGHFLAEQRDREGKLQDMRMKALAEADARAPLLLPGASLPSSHITVPAMPEEVPQALAAGTSPAPRVEPFLAGWDDDLGGEA
jgi:putative transposase